MSQPAGQQAATADQYDLGSPGADQAAPQVPQPPAAVATPGAPLRRPDGTFLPKHSHPDRLVAEARTLGISDEDIAAMSAADLRADVRDARLERMLNRRDQTVNAALDREPAPQPAAPTAPAFEVPEFSDEYDDNIRALAKTVKTLTERLAALEGGVGEIKGFHQAQANKTLTEQCDAFFAKDPDLYGKGGVDDLKADGPEMARRMVVIEQAKKLDRNLPVAVKLQKAQDTIYPGARKAPVPATPPPAEPKPTRPTPEQWQEAGVARPTQREGGAEPAGKKKAMETIQRYYQENGVGRDEPNVADEFPG